MKERPIISSAPMVRAILAGTKTQTRRVVRLRAGESAHEGGDGRLHAVANTTWGCCVERVIQCPYGVPGDLLWVRETWATTEQAGDHSADRVVVYRATDPDWETMEGWQWRPSIFMPRWASRLTLRITSVRVERVQEIPEADARAEGFKDVVGKYARGDEARIWFAELWDIINAARGFGWDTNPWVWVIGFERVQRRSERREAFARLTGSAPNFL